MNRGLGLSLVMLLLERGRGVAGRGKPAPGPGRDQARVCEKSLSTGEADVFLGLEVGKVFFFKQHCLHNRLLY